jgi:hypothetical protein
MKEKIYLYVNTTTQRILNKLIQTFLIEDFFHLPPVSMTPMAHLKLQIPPQIFEKCETARMVYSGAWGKLSHEKT